jgi:HAD superfamily hydrolase (TIGR01549 family)
VRSPMCGWYPPVGAACGARSGGYRPDMDPQTSAVLLDIDGTLIDSTYHHAVAWHRAFGSVTGDPPPLWRVHRAIGMGGDRLVAHVAGQQVEDAQGDRIREAWREEYLALRQEVRPLPGATDLLRRLAADGYRVALASSGDPQFSHEAVDLLEAADLVEVLTTSEDVDDSKPEPDLLGETLRRLDGVEQAVLVGDTVYDVESAARAGIGCVAVLTGGYARAELTEAGATLVADGPADLVDLHWPVYLSPF